MKNYVTKKEQDFEMAVEAMDIVDFIVFDKSKNFYICDTLTEAERLAVEIGGTIYFYRRSLVNNIIANIDNKHWDIINNADDEAYDFDAYIRRNAKKRLMYHLNRFGLTLTDWELWCTL